MSILRVIGKRKHGMGNLTGGCLRGQVRCSAIEDPVMVAAYHCTVCQHQTDTAYSVTAAVPAQSFSISGDSLSVYEGTSTSGQPTQRHFCKNCGSPLYTNVIAMEGVLFIKAGTLDNSEQVSSSAGIWCESNLSWANLDADLPTMPGNPPAG